jgi:hypothetical protein
VADITKLMAVLSEVIGLLRRPDANAAWSKYEVHELASMLEDHLTRLAAGSPVGERMLSDLRFLFAPTGPLQETSISSGWGDRFLDLAARFDRAVA